MAIEFGTIANYGLIALIINGVLLWIREFKKHNTWKQNGEDLKEIKSSTLQFTDSLEKINEHVSEINVKMAEVKTSVSAQGKQCGKTVNRFDKAISQQYSELIDLAKTVGSKK